jgi:hypothetical protein
LKFPFEQSNALKLAGVTEDKIQFFSAAHFVETDQKISEMMASKDFDGNNLLLSGNNSEGTAPPLEKNDRIQREYEVTRYDANNIRILVKGATRGEWLYYADSWHPFWSVTVNGESAVLYKANLAYKAVMLKEGENIVHFRFHSLRMALLVGVLEWNGVAWVFASFCLLWRKSSA